LKNHVPHLQKKKKNDAPTINLTINIYLSNLGVTVHALHQKVEMQHQLQSECGVGIVGSTVGSTVGHSL